MRKILQWSLGIMTLATVAFGYWPIAHYEYERGREDLLKYVPVKSPMYFGVYKSYRAILSSPTSTWNTTDQLGIVFISDDFNSSEYKVFVEDEHKIQWMRDGERPNVKYNDKYYNLRWLEIMPGIDLEHGIIVGAAISLGILWVVLIIVIIADRSSKKDTH